MPESAKPFPFIVGSGRCGSTLLRIMFDSHPEMAVPREVYFPIPAPPHWFDRSGRIDVSLAVDDLERTPWYPKLELGDGVLRNNVDRSSPKDYPDLIRCMYRTYAAAQGKPRYGNKSPMHVAHLRTLADMFPEARFIHLVRDGRNVALSYLEVPFGPSDLPGAANAWRSRVSRGRRAGQALGPERYRELRYEDLLEDPEGELRRICSFIDLTYDDAMLRYYERLPEMVIKSNPNPKLSLPPTKGLRDWRNEMEPWQVSLFESIAGPALEQFGYECARLEPSLGDRVRIGTTRNVSELRKTLRRRARTPIRWIRSLDRAGSG